MTRKRSIGLKTDPGIGRLMIPHVILPYLGSRFNNEIIAPFTANHTYLIEIHTVYGDRVDWYVDGSLDLTQDISSVPGGGLTVLVIGWSLGNTIDPLRTFNIWNVKIGTSRGASDVFNAPLDSIPAPSPFTEIEDPNGPALSIQDIDGIDTLKCYANGAYPRLRKEWSTPVTDAWTTFNWRAPESIATRYIADGLDVPNGPLWPFMVIVYNAESRPLARFGMVFE